MNRINRVLCYGFVLLLFGCASTGPVEPVPTEELKAAVDEVVALQKAADIDQAELLSVREYRKGSDYLARAQRGMSSGYDPEYVLENAAAGKVQLQQALDNARARTPNAYRILEARRAALDAGLKNSPDLEDALLEIDDGVRAETREFTRPLEPAVFSNFQKQYFSLEVEAVQFRELGAVRQDIDKATEQDADRLTPESLKTALLDVNEAENLIAQGPRNPGIYRGIVDVAVESAAFLTDVLGIVLDAPGTPEKVAARVVDQNHEIETLSDDIDELEQELKSARSMLREKEDELKQKDRVLVQREDELKQKDLTLQQRDAVLKEKELALMQQDEQLKTTLSSLQEKESVLLLRNQELEESSTQVRFQRAMDQVVQQFSEDEATVYQQGSQLVFRLKKINFSSGSAAVPDASKPLLSKINDIIRDLGAELVSVEGHTDSVGSDELNQELSSKRAISVADYLGSLAGGYRIGFVGHGESRPIASNETPEGRAINRRVDLVVTARK